MEINLEFKKTDKKDHFKMVLNGVDLGIWERSQVRQLISQLDNKI